MFDALVEALEGLRHLGLFWSTRLFGGESLLTVLTEIFLFIIASVRSCFKIHHTMPRFSFLRSRWWSQVKEAVSHLNFTFSWLQIDQILVIMIPGLSERRVSPRVELFVVFAYVNSMILPKLKLFYSTACRKQQLGLLYDLVLKPLPPDKDPASLSNSAGTAKGSSNEQH